ncbi:glycoside hydrolase family 18 protein [Trametes sanguinea]|nr:glycoside hydrolase family 18 protein [Trametes sanguinea]
MFSTSFSRLFTLCSALASLSVGFAAPHARRAQIPSGPKFVVYTDAAIDSTTVLPPLEQIAGFNVVNMAFLLTSGPADQVAKWAALPADQRQQLKQQYNSAGVSLVVSAFGETEHPTSQDPATVANGLAQFVLNNDLDGIDIDYEEFELVVQQPGVGEAWLTTLTQTLRQQLPQGQFILSHAPVGPWFQPTFCPGGCYITVDKNVGSLIDWYNIQFYNQSPSPGYEDCNTLLNSAGGSSIFEIKANGVDVNKLVIGKPGTTADITNGGFIDPATLNTCIQQAVSNGWNAGVMAFQFPHADTTWISTVKGNAFGA